MLQNPAMVKIDMVGAYVAYMAQSSVIARSEDIVCLTTWQVLLHCENA
jgi:hypothetical protein